MSKRRLWFTSRKDRVHRKDRARGWRLERRVGELEHRLSDLSEILDTLGEGVLAVDRAGIVLHANPSAGELLGFDETAALGSHMFAFLRHDAFAELVEDAMRNDEGARSARRELQFDVNGRERLGLVTVQPLRTGGRSDGAVRGAVAVIRDVTELRRLERARQDFFANVSHELKTPVTAIRGAIETILDTPDMQVDDRVRFLDGARRHTRRLSNLMADLLQLARLEHDPDALHVSNVDLASLMRDVMDDAQPAADRRGITFDAQLDSLHAMVDAEAMRQALDNLVDNALAYAHEGGTVGIRLRESRRQRWIMLEVFDDGPGIDEAERERVFERFYRVDADRSRARGGTGLGLSIVKHVAQAHGGDVRVHDSEFGGARFAVRIPVSHRSPSGTSST